jgi:hypothetical protein
MCLQDALMPVFVKSSSHLAFFFHFIARRLIDDSIENTRSSLPLRVSTLCLGHLYMSNQLFSTVTNIYLFVIYVKTL